MGDFERDACSPVTVTLILDPNALPGMVVPTLSPVFQDPSSPSSPNGVHLPPPVEASQLGRRLLETSSGR
jgi:hypothetical protein